MQFNKKVQRLKRAKKTRARIKSKGKLRLVVNKTNQHIYAQIIDSVTTSSGDQVLVQASTLDKDFNKDKSKSSSTNKDSAKKIGLLIAERAKAKNIKKIAFDRSGYKYHGCIKDLADAAREAGMEF